MGLIPSFSAKDLIELVKTGATIEAQERILELRTAALNLQDENLVLREKIRELEQQLSLDRELQWDGAIYWRKAEDGRVDGPFCPRCKDGNSKLARLRKVETQRGEYVWHCTVCAKAIHPAQDAQRSD